MSFLLSHFPTEIVNTHIVPLLHPDDLINLVTNFDLPVNHQVYDQTFLTNSMFDRYDKELFVTRMNAKLWIFGRPFRRTCEDFDPSIHETIEAKYWPLVRTYRPYQADLGEEVITKVVCSETCIGALTSHGDLYISDMESSKPFLFEKAMGRRNKEDYYKPHSAERDPVRLRLRAVSDMVSDRPYRPSRFVDILNMSNIVAVDEDGLLWEWELDWGDKPETLQGIPFLQSDEKTVVTERVIRFVGDMALTENRGLLSVGYVRSGQTNRPDQWKNGYPYTENGFGYASFKTLPYSPRNVRGCFQLTYALNVLWHNDGDVFIVDSKESPTEMHKFIENGPHPLLDICDNLLIAVSRDGRTVITKDSNHNTEFPPGLEHVTIASVAAGNGHFVALTTEGDVYSWGVEENCLGCLGLGHYDNAIKIEGVSLTMSEFECNSLVLDIPTKIDLPGKAVGIVAGSGVTAVLM